MKNNVKLYRTKNNVSKQELANSLEIHENYISMIERNSRTPGFKLAKKMADFFKITVDALFFCPVTEQNIQINKHK